MVKYDSILSILLNRPLNPDPKIRKKTVEEFYDKCDLCGQEFSGRTVKELQKNLTSHKFFKHERKP